MGCGRLVVMCTIDGRVVTGQEMVKGISILQAQEKVRQGIFILSQGKLTF